MGFDVDNSEVYDYHNTTENSAKGRACKSR